MSHKGKRTKAETLYEIRLLWHYDNPANIARRLGYSSVDNMLRTLERWPEADQLRAAISAADTLQRGRGSRKQLLEAS